MAFILNNILKRQPQSRIITYAGSVHFGYLPIYEQTATNVRPVGDYLSEKGILTYRITYAGGPTASEETEDFLLPDRITKAALRARLSKEKFGVRLDDTVKTKNWGHYIIHLPQKDN